MCKNLKAKRKITEKITEKLKHLKFQGLTGPISFTDNKEREGIIVVKQFRNGDLVKIGSHYTKEDKFVLCCNFTKESLFKDGRIPFDSSQNEQLPRIVAPELFIIFSTASAIGIVLGIMFLVFNRYYRKYK
ncbi:hypothetical protein OS493_013492 [Desmophyllum pertusum]|uniref:Uncharacterized protein n=1 Tax=Desmophyllum pertusum TaxID=174260 RepID=A0A9X0A2Z5_9CNID|nr:hypothetical protein OS493_013492 [Desmophyllum pertusum]